MKNKVRKSQLWSILTAKYTADPEGFRSYLPEIADMIEPRPSRRWSRSPFGLTKHERTHHLEGLRKILQNMESGAISKEEAVLGLEHCAALIEDDSLPSDVDYKTLKRLLQAAIGKTPGSFKQNAEVPILPVQGDEIVFRIPLVRGVILSLTRERRLARVEITPRKVQERQHGLAFVGIARDTASDVAQRHDDYLAGVVLYGSS